MTYSVLMAMLNPTHSLTHFDASYKAKYTMTNLKLVQFTFSHAIKADKKWKLKLKISNA